MAGRRNPGVIRTWPVGHGANFWQAPDRSDQPAEPAAPPAAPLSKTEAAFLAMRQAQKDAKMRTLNKMLGPKRRKPAPR